MGAAPNLKLEALWPLWARAHLHPSQCRDICDNLNVTRYGGVSASASASRPTCKVALAPCTYIKYIYRIKAFYFLIPSCLVHVPGRQHLAAKHQKEL